MTNDTMKSFIDRLDMIEDELLGVRLARDEVYAEAVNAGHDREVLRRIVAEYRMDKDKLAKRRALEDKVGQYRLELGL